MKLDCKHILIMRLSEEASFEAKDKVIQWPVHDCIVLLVVPFSFPAGHIADFQSVGLYYLWITISLSVPGP